MWRETVNREDKTAEMEDTLRLGGNTLVPCQYAQITVTACLFRASCFRRLSSIRAWWDVVGVRQDGLKDARRKRIKKRKVEEEWEEKEKWQLCDQQSKQDQKRKRQQ